MAKRGACRLRMRDGGGGGDRGDRDDDGGAVYDVAFDSGSSRSGVAERWVEPLMLVRYDETHAQDVFSPRLLLAQAVPTSQPGGASGVGE